MYPLNHYTHNKLTTIYTLMEAIYWLVMTCLYSDVTLESRRKFKAKDMGYIAHPNITCVVGHHNMTKIILVGVIFFNLVPVLKWSFGFKL